MVPEYFTFEIALYLGRIKKGPKPYDDDLLAALIHDNVTNGFGFRALKSMVKSEGYADFWGTDKIMPETGTQGRHSKEEMEEAFSKLQKKLQGNPEVVMGRYVTFLEFADICVQKKIFKKDSNLKIVQKAMNVKRKDDSKKAMIDKARTESLAICPELAATYGQGELQLMNVLSQEVGAEVEVKGNDEVKTLDNVPSRKKTKTPKTVQTLELAGIDEVVLNAHQLEDISMLESNILKYRELAIKVQKENLELMKTNDKQAKQLSLEKKASINNMEELIDIKMKPVLETLKNLPRQIKLVVEEGFKNERILTEARDAEEKLSDQQEIKSMNERDAIAEHTQDMVRQIYDYIKPVDVTALGNLDDEAPVAAPGNLDHFGGRLTSGVEEEWQSEDNTMVDDNTLDEVIVLDDLMDHENHKEENELIEQDQTKEELAGKKNEKKTQENRVAEDKVGRKISVVLNQSRKSSKSGKKNGKNVSFHNGERMFEDFVTPRREDLKTPVVPERPSRWNPHISSTPTIVEDNRKRELVEEQKKREVLEGRRKERATLLEAQRLEAKRKVEKELRDAQRRKMDSQEDFRKKEMDAHESRRKERELMEAQRKEKELTETRKRKEMELIESQKKEKEVTETRKRMAREVEEARRKEELGKERRTRDVRMARGEQGLSRDGRWKEEHDEDSRTVSFNHGEGRERSREREGSRDRSREREGSRDRFRERFRERRGNSPGARRSLGEKFRRCQGSVVYFNVFLS